MEEPPKSYDPKKTELKWYSFWEDNGFFKPRQTSFSKSFSIVIPPPNVTGSLHMGHALSDTLQDVIVRWKRMSGFKTVWVPGADHAGIATQTVVERELFRELGKKRTDFSREEFVAHVWKWKNSSEKRIIEQLKQLGCSCDWSRWAFTMDPSRSKAVKQIFKELFEEGLIYRGDYLVNWDPVSGTALSDDEVEYEERSTPLYHLQYFLADSQAYLTVATNRPETSLCDTAVAVFPEDIRYQKWIGYSIVVPLVHRRVPIIGDTLIDPTFGTGVVKITPAHDLNDYIIAGKHGLPFINIMTPDGCLNENGGSFQGLKMEQARQVIVQQLQAQNLIEKIEPYTTRVGVSYRSKSVIEPYLAKQWFIRCDRFKKRLIERIESGDVRLIPDHFRSTYFHWIDNLRDWCISRQLWWGHRIPIWYRIDEPRTMICHIEEGVPQEVAQDPSAWVEETDVLDTWFSSALWPFAAMGWPLDSEAFREFYPTSLLITGHDILFFWVARMMMMAEYVFKAPPFQEVFFHGLVFGKSYWREKNGAVSYLSYQERVPYDSGIPTPPDVFSCWEKMSKSKGNVIDPIEMIDLYGADAVRMTLIASTTQARQIDLDRRRFEEFKNFANKIWNGARFVLMNTKDIRKETPLDHTSLEDHWILSKMNRTIQRVNDYLSSYAYDKAALLAYDFFWNDFCSCYLEMAKPFLFAKLGTPKERENKGKMLIVVLCNLVRLLHPMVPFITEELFQLLKIQTGFYNPKEIKDPYVKEALEALHSPSCIVASYPKVVDQVIDEKIERRFSLLQQLIQTVRHLRSEGKIEAKEFIELSVMGDAPKVQFVQTHESLLKVLLRLKSISYLTEGKDSPDLCAVALVDQLKLMIPLSIDKKVDEEKRLKKRREKLETQREGLEAQLKNVDFLLKAPKEQVEKTHHLLQKLQHELTEISSLINKL